MIKIPLNEDSTVSVRGFAEIEVPPDFATASFNVTATAVEADDALAMASEDAAACRAVFAESVGVRQSRVSRVRVQELNHWNKERDQYISDGYSATLTGSAEIEVRDAAGVIERLVDAGARISWVGWDVDRDNPAYRQARKLAVADAHRAANDFADAIGAALGSLATLADPGLLEAGRRTTGDHGAGSRVFSAMSVDDSGSDELELDPEPQRVQAHVEACFYLAGA